MASFTGPIELLMGLIALIVNGAVETLRFLARLAAQLATRLRG
jgi:hypothetical protein